MGKINKNHFQKGSNKNSGNLNSKNSDTAVAEKNSSDLLKIEDKEEVLDMNKEKDDDFFGWPVLDGFKDLKEEKTRFQLHKNTLDKSIDLDVNKIIGGIAETSKKEDKQIYKEKRLDDKRLHKITGGREQINNQDNFGVNQSRLSQGDKSTSTEGNILKGENQDSAVTAYEGKPKLSRRAKARANRVDERSDEQGVLQAVEGDKVNGKSSEIVQSAVPPSHPFDEKSVESSLQSAKIESAESVETTENKLPSHVNEQGFVKGMVSNTPAGEGKGSLVVAKQNGTAEGKGVQSLSVLQTEKNVIKNASKGFLLLFSEKTDEILSPLSFMAHNHTKMAMAIIQLLIPALLTYFLTTRVEFINAGVTSAALPMKFVLYAIFYIGCLCGSIFMQVLASGIKGMFIKAFIEAATIGESKK